jgi:effector-binding domain-containing protein
MKTFGKIILWIVIILAILVIIAYILPRQYKVERHITVGADKAILYTLTCNLNLWDLWSPWTKEFDSTAQFELSGTDCEVGTIWKWDGKLIGNGQLRITETNPGERFSYDLSFDEGKMHSNGYFRYEPAGEDSVTVFWSDEGDLGFNPVNRYLGLFLEKMMAPDFEKGLAKLKEVAEERATWPLIEEKMISEQIALLVRDSAGPETYGQVMGRGYGEIMQMITRKKLKMTGAPFAIYIFWDSATQRSVFDLGIPIDTIVPVAGRIRVETIPAQEVVIAHYFGSYDKTADTYYILDKYIMQSKRTVAGSPWEIYITDPMTEPDTMKWETQIIFPVR